MVEWLAKAVEEVRNNKKLNCRVFFEKTGCNITLYGTGDNSIIYIFL